MQVYSIDSNATVEIMPYDSESTLKMIFESVVKLEKGIGTFSNLGFIGKPETKDNKFTIRSQLITTSQIIEMLG